MTKRDFSHMYDEQIDDPGRPQNSSDSTADLPAVTGSTGIRSKHSAEQLVSMAHKLFDLVEKAERKVNGARIEAGRVLLELRGLIEGSGLRWWDYYEERFARSRRDAEKLMSIASAEDQQKALHDANARNAAHQRAYREHQRAVSGTAAYSKPHPEAVIEAEPVEPEIFPPQRPQPTPKPPKAYPEAPEDAGRIEQIIQLFHALSWGGRRKAIQALSKAYEDFQRTSRSRSGIPASGRLKHSSAAAIETSAMKRCCASGRAPSSGCCSPPGPSAASATVGSGIASARFSARRPKSGIGAILSAPTRRSTDGSKCARNDRKRGRQRHDVLHRKTARFAESRPLRPTLNHCAKVVMAAVVDHLNERSERTKLSDNTIASEIGSTPRHVRRAREELREAKWLTWSRTRTANIYAVNFSKGALILAAMKRSREAKREKFNEIAEKPAEIGRPSSYLAAPFR